MLGQTEYLADFDIRLNRIFGRIAKYRIDMNIFVLSWYLKRIVTAQLNKHIVLLITLTHK